MPTTATLLVVCSEFTITNIARRYVGEQFQPEIRDSEVS